MTAQDTTRAALVADRKFLLEIGELTRFSAKQADRATRAFVALDAQSGVDASQKAAAAGSALLRLISLAEDTGLAARHRSPFLAALTGDEDEIWSYFRDRAAELG